MRRLETAPLIRTFSHHCRQKFGFAVGKVSVDMGQVCPNRSQGGCIFCRAASYTPGYLKKEDEISEQLRLGKKHFLRGRFSQYFAYFQQESCTAVDEEFLLPVLSLVLEDEDCVGLILSTRPDYIEASFIDLLTEIIEASGKECLFELGVQSVHERSLQLLNRNHSYLDFVHAAHLIQAPGCFELGAHLIFGIPGESEEEMLESVRTVCSLNINALKLHHLQVIRETSLHKMYLQGKVGLFTLDTYIDFLMKAIVLVPEEVTIHRLWSTSHPDLLVGPRWNILAGQLSAILHNKMLAQGVSQGQQAE